MELSYFGVKQKRGRLAPQGTQVRVSVLILTGRSRRLLSANCRRIALTEYAQSVQTSLYVEAGQRSAGSSRRGLQMTFVFVTLIT